MAVLSAGAQTDRHFIRQGNREFRAKNYAQAEVNYKKSLGKNSSNAIAAYNLGRALQAGRKDSLALKQYETAANLEKTPPDEQNHSITWEPFCKDKKSSTPP